MKPGAAAGMNQPACGTGTGAGMAAGPDGPGRGAPHIRASGPVAPASWGNAAGGRPALASCSGAWCRPTGGGAVIRPALPPRLRAWEPCRT